jgi:hypothetical protein
MSLKSDGVTEDAAAQVTRRILVPELIPRGYLSGYYVELVSFLLILNGFFAREVLY